MDQVGLKLNLLASVCQVLGLQVCTTRPLFVNSFLKRHTVHRSGLGPIDKVQATCGLISMFPTELYIWEHTSMSVYR